MATAYKSSYVSLCLKMVNNYFRKYLLTKVKNTLLYIKIRNIEDNLKKIIIITIVLVNIYGNCFSDDNFYGMPILNLGTIGTGIYFQKDSAISFDFTLNLIKIGYAIKGFGVETTLLNYQYSNIYNGHCISLLSPRFFVNIYHWLLSEYYFDVNSDHLLLRLYSSINYFNSYSFSKIDLNNIIYSISLAIVNIDQIAFYNCETFSIEIGYKNVSGRHYIFTGIKIDPLFSWILIPDKIKDKKNIRKRHNDT